MRPSLTKTTFLQRWSRAMKELWPDRAEALARQMARDLDQLLAQARIRGANRALGRR